jgi:hypothetical protein
MLADLLSGGLSGIVSRTATAPIELYKIQRQNPYMPHSTLRDVLHKEGFLYLWKGNGTNCLRVFPQFGINYAVYRAVESNIPVEVFSSQELRRLISGGISGSVAMTCIYPLETIRSRLTLQTQRGHYTGVVDALRKTPLRDLYGGLRMSIYGFGPFNALNFMYYYQYKLLLGTLGVAPSTTNFLSGGLAGISALSVTYPTDLIRRRLQMQGFDKAVPQYNGIIDCARKIIHQEGIMGLYRGLGAGYLKVFPTLAIQFWSMELFSGMMKDS